MSNTRKMLETSPSRVPGVDVATLAECIDACLECAQACTTCADACMAEAEVARLMRCVRLNLHCGDICTTTARVLSRQEMPDRARALVETCALACGLCAEEGEKHADHMTHCQVCAEACRRCEQACRALLAALPA